MKRTSLSTGLSIGLLACACVVVPACLYPDYSFNELEPSGGGGDATGTTNGTMATGGAGGAGGAGGNPTTSANGGNGGNGGDSGSENCLNGVDDDADGDIDCADSNCGDFSCVSAVPDTWTGHFLLYNGPPGMDPDCPSSFPGTTNVYLGNGGLDAPLADCSDCTCDAPTGEVCNVPTEVTTQDAAVNGACGEAVPNSIFCTGDLPLGPANGTCVSNPFLPSQNTCGPNPGPMCTTGTAPCNVSATALATTVTAGACAPLGGVPTLPTVTWASLGRGCGDPAAAGQGCNGTQVCLPKPEAPYESGVCISKPGDNDCPPGAFAEKHVFFEDFTDTRGCEECNCGDSAGSTCTATIQIYSDNACANLTASFPAGGCANIAGNPAVRGRKISITEPPNGGACPATGGGAIGDVEPITPTTFCCVP